VTTTDTSIQRKEHGHFAKGSSPNPEGGPKRGESIAELMVSIGNQGILRFENGKPVMNRRGTRQQKIQLRKYLFNKVYELAATGQIKLVALEADPVTGATVERIHTIEVRDMEEWLALVNYIARMTDPSLSQGKTRTTEVDLAQGILRIIEHNDSDENAVVDANAKKESTDNGNTS
jgi:hypothetical protein